MTPWAGNLIRLARHDAHLSQRELAQRAGTSQATISAYESGGKSPSLATLVRIIRAAGSDLRIQLVPRDSHDEVLALYEQSLPVEAVAASRRQDRDLIAMAQRGRRRSATKR
jgi:transcriptional regulator with XRE-family HTH domain